MEKPHQKNRRYQALHTAVFFAYKFDEVPVAPRRFVCMPCLKNGALRGVPAKGVVVYYQNVETCHDTSPHSDNSHAGGCSPY